jgi:hypothetical protein
MYMVSSLVFLYRFVNLPFYKQSNSLALLRLVLALLIFLSQPNHYIHTNQAICDIYEQCNDFLINLSAFQHVL